MRNEAYDELGECILNLDCIGFDANVCFAQVAASLPASLTDGLVDAMCDKAVECDAEVVKQDCIDDMKTENAEDLLMLRILKDEVLECVEDCMSALDCPLMEGDFDDCLLDCDIPILD